MIHRRKFLQLSGAALSNAMAYQLMGCGSTAFGTKRAWGVPTIFYPSNGD